MTNIDLIVILGFWLFTVCYSCLLWIIVSDFTKQKAKKQVTVKFTSYDFKDNKYREYWQEQFAIGFSQMSSYKYLKLAEQHNFIMSGKDCCQFWNDMIRECKPASPSKPIYYDHADLHLRSKPLTNAEIMVWAKPTYQYYSGNGYGSRNSGMNTTPLCGEDWIREHYKKYPDGLPEQTIIVTKVKKSDIIAEAEQIVKATKRKPRVKAIA